MTFPRLPSEFEFGGAVANSHRGLRAQAAAGGVFNESEQTRSIAHGMGLSPMALFGSLIDETSIPAQIARWPSRTIVEGSVGSHAN